MFRIINGKSLITIFFMLSYGQILSASDLVAKKSGVKVTKEADASSEVVTSLDKDQVVKSLSRKGMFWKIKTPSGAEGYVSVMNVKRQSHEARGLSDAIREATVESREAGDQVSTNRARTAVMGVRGLDESNETALAGSVRPNFDLVYQMEDRIIEPKRIQSLQSRIQNEIGKRAQGDLSDEGIN